MSTYTPPPRVLRGRRGPTNHDSRPYATAEKVAKLESLSPIFKVSNVATGGEKGAKRESFFFSPTSVRKRPRRRATALQGRERADRGSLSTWRSREIANRPTSSPVEPTLPKNLQSPKWKKKKKFPQYYPRSKALVESDISIASPGRGPSRTSSWLFFVENSTRANELGCQKTRLSETRLLVPRDMSRDQRASLGMRSRVWDPPRFRNSDTLKALPTLGTCAKFLPPRSQTSFRGTPRKHSRKGSEIDASDASGGRAFRARAAIFGTRTVLWGN